MNYTESCRCTGQPRPPAKLSRHALLRAAERRVPLHVAHRAAGAALSRCERQTPAGVGRGPVLVRARSARGVSVVVAPATATVVTLWREDGRHERARERALRHRAERRRGRAAARRLLSRCRDEPLLAAIEAIESTDEEWML